MPTESEPLLIQLTDRLGEVVDASDQAIAQYARSSNGHSVSPLAVIRPIDVAGVVDAVRAAAAMGLCVYPTSRGCNWGYGDASPGHADHLLLDLSGMNRIHTVDERLGYVVLEPGVTQRQLDEYLKAHAPSLMMDATGASTDASLVGNTLDRGFGHTPYGDHCGQACDLQVVLGDGRVIDTGMGRFGQGVQSRGVYRWGVGPSIDGLFSQSNFGIVTRMTVWLMRRPVYTCAFLAHADREDQLGDLLDRLAELRRRDLLRSAVHVGNDLRTISSHCQYPWDRAGGQTPLPNALRDTLRREQGVAAWNVAGALYGTRRTVAPIKSELKRALRPYRLMFLDDRRLAWAKALARGLDRTAWGSRLARQIELFEPVYGLMKGIPTDETVRGMLWRVREPTGLEGGDLLDSSAGLMWVSPLVPCTGEHAQAVCRLMRPIYRAHGFDFLATFTLISERAMICVTNIAFDKHQDQEVQAAHLCYEALYASLLDAGYPPYRAGHHGQTTLAPSGTYGELLEGLKRAVDPAGIIAPHRYANPS